MSENISDELSSSIQLKDYIQSPGPHYFSSSYINKNMVKLMKKTFNAQKNKKGSSDAMRLNYSKEQLLSLDLIPPLELLDVNLAIRNLENSQRWKHLLTEAFGFTVLMIIYVAFVAVERYFPDLVLSETAVNENIIMKTLPVWRNVRESEPAEWVTNQTLYPSIAEMYSKISCANPAFIAPCNLSVCTFDAECGKETISNIATNRLKTNYQSSKNASEINWKDMCIKSRRLLNFQSISSFEDFESWMDYFIHESALFDQVNGRAVMLDYNMVLGAVRLRQVRSGPQSCKNVASLRNTTQLKRFDFVPCFDYYNINTQNKNPLVLTNSAGGTSTYYFQNASSVYNFQFRDKNNGQIVNINFGPPEAAASGEYLISKYDYGGYVVDIPSGNRCAASKIWNELRNQRFIDPLHQGTAALFITFSLLNPAINGYVFASLLLEFLPGDVIHTSTDIRTYRIQVLQPNTLSGFTLPSASPTSFFTIASLVLSMLFIVYYLFTLYLDSRYVNNRSDLFDGWRILDFLQLSLIQASIWQLFSFRQKSAVLIQNSSILSDSSLIVNNVSTSMVNSSTYLPFLDSYSYNLQLNLAIAGSVMIVSSVKYFKYLDLVPRFGVAWRTISAVRTALIGWGVVYLIIFFSFALSGFLFFGPFSVSFRSVPESLLTVFFFSVGSFMQSNIERISALSSLTETASLVPYDLIALPLSFPTIESVNLLAGFRLWLILFTIAFHWVLINLLYGVIILGYQKVFRNVEIEEAEAEQLSKHERLKYEANKSKRYVRGSNEHSGSQLIFKAKNFFQSYEFSDIVIRLKTDEEVMKKGFITRIELGKIISDVIKSDTRVDELVEYMMSKYSINLNHVEESVLVYEKLRSLAANYRETPGYGVFDLRRSIIAEEESEKDQENNRNNEGVDSFTSAILKENPNEEVEVDYLSLEQQQLPPLPIDDNKFDPAAEEKWTQALLTGDSLLCMAFIQNMQMGSETKRLLKMLKLLDGENRVLIQAIDKLEKKYGIDREKKMNESNPLNGIFQDENNKSIFHVHHVSGNGVYRYVGKFKSYNEAESAYARVSLFVAKKENEAKENESNKQGFFSNFTLGSSKKASPESSSLSEGSKLLIGDKLIPEDILTAPQEGAAKSNVICMKIKDAIVALLYAVVGYEWYDESLVCNLASDGNWYTPSGDFVEEQPKAQDVPPRAR